jgi:mannosyltransferase
MNLIKKFTSSYLLVTVLFLGLILRLISINQSFWLDEATSGYVARDFNINSIVNDFSPGDFHPPLHYALLNIWSRLFGASEISLRIPSVVFSLLTIMLVYAIVGELIKDKFFPKFAASLLLATSGLHIYYSQEARMYAMSAFLVSLLIYAFLKTIKAKSGLYFVMFAIGLVLNFLTDYLPNLIIPVFWIYAFLAVRDKKWWLKFLISHIPLIIVILLWYPYLKAQLSLGLSVKGIVPYWWLILGKTNIKELVLLPTKFMLGRISFDNKILYGAIVGLLGFLYTVTILYPLKSLKTLKIKSPDLIIWLWLIIPLLLAAIIGLKISVFSYFRLIFALPAFYILIAVGLTKMKTIYKITLLLILFWANLISSGIYLSNPKFHREDWRFTTQFIKESSNESSLVLFPSATGTEAFKYYYPRAKISVQKLDEFSNDVWLVRYAQPIFDPQDITKNNLESAGYVKQAEFDFKGVVVWRYARYTKD